MPAAPFQRPTAVPSADGFAPARQLLMWLKRDALPRWRETGVDAGGGFHELLDIDARPVDAPRRTRVVARQLYVFATAQRRGWMQHADVVARHARSFLLGRLQRPDGSFASSVSPTGDVIDARFDLYEQAFALFGLAHAAKLEPGDPEPEQHALALLEHLARWRTSRGGFADEAGGALLRANPHMHLLEACLAWEDVSERPARWTAISDEIVELMAERMLNPRTGAVLEWFDDAWRAVDGPGAPVEPGHQYEWAWLLAQWSVRREDRDAAANGAIVARLIDIGERHGACADDVVRNGLDRALEPLDLGCRLWAQAERIRALAMAVPGSRPAADLSRIGSSVGVLLRFLEHPCPGLWHESLDAHGHPVAGPSRASSLYHIVGSVEALVDSHTTEGNADRPSDRGGPVRE